MTRFLWVLTAIGSVLGALVALIGIMGAKGAPQEAAAAAIGIAFAVIPYCLARAASAMELINSFENNNASCSECKESVRRDAKKCKHCGSTLTPARVELP